MNKLLSAILAATFAAVTVSPVAFAAETKDKAAAEKKDEKKDAKKDAGKKDAKKDEKKS